MISYIHYVRSINFFRLILQCHNIHTIDFNDIYNLVETCVYIFLKRISPFPEKCDHHEIVTLIFLL